MKLTLRDTLAQSCKELTLANFIKCLMHSDFKYLVKRRGLLRVKEAEAQMKWLGIYQEFTEAGDTGHGAAYLSLMKQRTVLSNKIDILETGLKSLSYGFNADLAKALNGVGLKVKFRKETLVADIEKAIKHLKSMLGTLSRIDKNLTPYLSGDAMKEEDFDEVMAALSKFQGYRLNAEEITVSEYINILNLYKKWQTPKK